MRLVPMGAHPRIHVSCFCSDNTSHHTTSSRMAPDAVGFPFSGTLYGVPIYAVLRSSCEVLYAG